MEGKFEILSSASPLEDGVKVYATTNINGKNYTGKKIIKGKVLDEINLGYEALEIISEEMKKELNK